MATAAPITHGSRMDHVYAIDGSNGYTYIGHCGQAIQPTGLLMLNHYSVFATGEIQAKSQIEGKSYSLVAAEMYLASDSSSVSVAISSDGRVGIHVLDEAVKQAERGGGRPAATG